MRSGMTLRHYVKPVPKVTSKKKTIVGKGTFNPLGQGTVDAVKPYRQMLFTADEQHLLNAQLVTENPQEHYRRFVIEQAVTLYRENTEKDIILNEKKLIENQEKATEMLRRVHEPWWLEALKVDYRFPPVQRRPMTLTLPNRPLYAESQFI